VGVGRWRGNANQKPIFGRKDRRWAFVLEKEENRTTVPFYGNGNRAILRSSGEAQKIEEKLRREINMRKGNNKVILVALALAMFVSMLPIELTAQTLQPRLLWEKRLPFKIYDIRMAGESGDVILSSKEARQIILYDRQANKRFHWGPRVDRQPFGVDISDNGNLVIYSSGWTERFVIASKIDIEKKGWDRRIHYCDRRGKEVWNRKMVGKAHLSPDGKLLAVAPAGGEGEGLTLLDSSAKMLWKYTYEFGGGADIIFSPDSNYIALTDGGIGYGKLRVFDKNGTLLWEKPQSTGTVSISEGLNYISTDPYYEIEKSHKGRVYDRNGNIVIEGFGFVSANGKILSLLLDNKTVTYSLPDIIVLREYPIQGSEVILSSDGRFMAIVGKRTNIQTNNNIFAIDMQENIFWETYVGGSPKISLTKDGKYLLVCSYEENKLSYYTLY
jgi:hypothetical protein